MSLTCLVQLSSPLFGKQVRHFRTLVEVCSILLLKHDQYRRFSRQIFSIVQSSISLVSNLSILAD